AAAAPAACPPRLPACAAPDLQKPRPALTMDLVEQPLDLLLLRLLVRRARVAMVEAVGEIPDSALRQETGEKVVALDHRASCRRGWPGEPCRHRAPLAWPRESGARIRSVGLELMIVVMHRVSLRNGRTVR